jgi:hypothetical protein
MALRVVILFVILQRVNACLTLSTRKTVFAGEGDANSAESVEEGITIIWIYDYEKGKGNSRTEMSQPRLCERQPPFLV